MSGSSTIWWLEPFLLTHRTRIARSSPVSWQHINMQGEFSFSEESLSEALRFDLAELVSFEWEAASRTSPD
jgi:hypothetical protein